MERVLGAKNIFFAKREKHVLKVPFLFLLKKNLVSLGLYRMPGSADNKQPYVYTNPDWKKTTITVRDRVFVLGLEVPKELDYDQEK